MEKSGRKKFEKKKKKLQSTVYYKIFVILNISVYLLNYLSLSCFFFIRV